MTHTTPKLPLLILTAIAAIICSQQCGAFCAKQQIAPRVDMQIALRQFIDDKGRVYGRHVVPYKYILEACREIHIKNSKAFQETSPQETPARHSSPDSTVALSTCATNSIIESYAPMTILEALSLSQQSCAQAEPDPVSLQPEISRQRSHVPIVILVALSESLTSFPREIIEIIGLYVKEVFLPETWQNEHAVIIDVPKLIEPARIYASCLICQHQSTISVYNYKKNRLVLGPEKQKLLLAEALQKNDAEEKEQQELLATLKKRMPNIVSIETIRGGFVAIGHANGTVQIDLLGPSMDKPDCKHHKKFKAFLSSITALQQLPGGHLAVGSAQDGPLELWDPYKGEFIADLPGLIIPESTTNTGDQQNVLHKKYAGIAQLLATENLLIVIFDTSDEDPKQQSIVMYKNYLT